jgi:hypothetical protein
MGRNGITGHRRGITTHTRGRRGGRGGIKMKIKLILDPDYGWSLQPSKGFWGRLRAKILRARDEMVYRNLLEMVESTRAIREKYWGLF